MSDVFGDAEPEDSWHPDDAVGLLIHNLSRRIALLDHETEEPGADERQRLQRIAIRLDVVLRRREALTEREEVRAEQLAEDIDFVRARLG